MINVCKYGYKPEYGILIDTNSKSKTWSKQLSPFYLGPVYLACGIIAKNVENAWQFSKVYKHQIDSCGNPSELWYKWSMIGMNDNYAHRYPMGKNAIPEYTYYNKEKLSYIEARKKVYIPLYTQAVIKTEAYRNIYPHVCGVNEGNRFFNRTKGTIYPHVCGVNCIILKLCRY